MELTGGKGLLVVGLNHHAAPVEAREALAFAKDAIADGLRLLRETAGVSEAVILSTCNRVEVWAAGEKARLDDVSSFLLARGGRAAVDPSLLYRLADEEAVRHAFRVPAGLDSLVVGEAQILGQVKEAYRAAEEAGTLGPRLTTLRNHALAAAKRVRTETAIGRHAVSVSHVAVELALKIFGHVRGVRVMVVGAGKMSGMAARRLAREGAQLTVVGRTEARASALAAALGGRALAFERMAAELASTDVVLTGTAAPTTIIHRPEIEVAAKARGGRPLFLIDIALPRDVDPAVRDLPGVFLYDLDDLRGVAAANLRERQREATSAEKLVENEVLRHMADERAREAVPSVTELRGRAEGIRRAEIEKARRQMGPLTPEQERALDAVSTAIVNKLLHAPTVCLKDVARMGLSAEQAGLLRLALGLTA
ncbi:MAG TPA: glutamyl-tRNA reductase [Vicinamibacteria bacterium]|nr:glutamyl-tRNA reductase [Vicinamibacteria bacterium]